VLISVLIGVELMGFLGALLAIPAAGIIQVVVLDVHADLRGRLAPDAPGDGDGDGDEVAATDQS
jgi:predicted PurR-regulated permease PerM